MTTTVMEVEFVDDRFAGVDIDSLLQGGRRTLSYERRRALYEAPEFIQRLSGEETVLEGQSLCIDCKIRGFPVPSVRWFKDDEEILDHPRIHVESDGIGGYFLLIDCVTRGDEAAYRCRAENIEGACSSFLFLSVKGKPKRKDPVYCPTWRTVSYPPMFSTIVEKAEEEDILARECEGLPPPPLAEFYYALTLKSRCSWPTFLGAWAFASGGPLAGRQNEEYDDEDDNEEEDDDSDIDEQDNKFLVSKGVNCDSSMTRSTRKAHLESRKNLKRNDANARKKAKKQRIDGEGNNRIGNDKRMKENPDSNKVGRDTDTERRKTIEINGSMEEIKKKTEIEKRLEREREEHEEYERRERMYKEEEDMRIEKQKREERTKQEITKKDDTILSHEPVFKDKEEVKRSNRNGLDDIQTNTQQEFRRRTEMKTNNEGIKQTLQGRETNKTGTAEKLSQGSPRIIEDNGKTDRETKEEEKAQRKLTFTRDRLKDENFETKLDNETKNADDSRTRGTQRVDSIQDHKEEKETVPTVDSVKIFKYAVCDDFVSGQLRVGRKAADTNNGLNESSKSTFEESNSDQKGRLENVCQFGNTTNRTDDNRIWSPPGDGNRTWRIREDSNSSWRQSENINSSWRQGDDTKSLLRQREDINNSWRQGEDTNNSWRQRDDSNNSWRQGEDINNSRRNGEDTNNSRRERGDTNRQVGYQTSETLLKNSLRHLNQRGGLKQRSVSDRDRLEQLRQEEERYWQELQQEELNRLEELKREGEAGASGRRHRSQRTVFEDPQIKERKQIEELRRKEQLQKEELWKREKRQKEDLKLKVGVTEMLSSHGQQQQEEEIVKQRHELRLKELSQTGDLRQREFQQIDELKFKEFVQKEDAIALERNPRINGQPRCRTKQEMDQLRVEYKKEQMRKEQLRRQYEEEQNIREIRQAGTKRQKGDFDLRDANEVNKQAYLLNDTRQVLNQRINAGGDKQFVHFDLPDRAYNKVDSPKTYTSSSINKENEQRLKVRTSSKDDTEFSSRNQIEPQWDESWTRSLDRRPKKAATNIYKQHNDGDFHRRLSTIVDRRQQPYETNVTQNSSRTWQTHQEEYRSNVPDRIGSSFSSYSNGGSRSASATAQSSTSWSFASLFNLDDTRGSSPGIRTHHDLLKLADSIAAKREMFHESLSRFSHEDLTRPYSNSILDNVSSSRNDETISGDGPAYTRGRPVENYGDQIIKKFNQSDNNAIAGSQTDIELPPSSNTDGSRDGVTKDPTAIDIRPFICQSSRTTARRFHKKVTTS